MKTDKNTIIGFVLMGILFFVYFWYSNKQQQAFLAEKKRTEDSLARVNAAKVKPVDSAVVVLDSLKRDSAIKVNAAGAFAGAAIGTESFIVVENEVVKITFTNKGGVPKKVELKGYQNYNGQPVVLGSYNDALGYSINTAANQTAYTSDLFFTPGTVEKDQQGNQKVQFSITDESGKSIQHIYTIRPKDYLIDFIISLKGADQLITQGNLNINWNYQLAQQQRDPVYERQQSRICVVEDDAYDFFYAAEGTKKSFDTKVNWLSLKQQFFNATILASGGFKNATVELAALPDSLHQLFNGKVSASMQLPTAASAAASLQLYYGPNDYNLLKSYNNQMENIVDLGSGMFAFVKYINRWIIMPVFNFFASFIANFGWVIALLTLFIRLVTSPLTYSSYLSGAKMKALRPELDKLKQKFGDDQQGYAMEQMKLFREAGVNPLGGCIPALLQIPIFFALYSFFNASIDLRGESFLWAKDLSQYDVIAKLPFYIPLGFGNHISLFTLTAVITSFLISIYNMNMTPDQNNPMLKYMPYIFPFILLFIFNRLPSALTWYYTVSNLITLALQFVIQNYIIDHDKILAKIEANRKKPKTKSKWQEKYEQMLESKKKVQELKNKTKK